MKKLFICLMVMFAMTVAAQEYKTHTVQRGETISSIAAKYQVSVDDIKNANPHSGGLVYVGMKLKIPVSTISMQMPPAQDTVVNQSSTYNIYQQPAQQSTSMSQMSNQSANKSNDMDDRKESTIEIDYAATTYDDIKLSGSYGFSMTMLPWKIVDDLYVGIHFTPFHFNFGLVDKELTSDLITLGPALGYYFTPTIFVTLPVELMCYVYFKDSSTKTSWGMACTPSIYLGTKKFGVFAGPMFSFPFVEGGTEISTGFRAGIYF